MRSETGVEVTSGRKRVGFAHRDLRQSDRSFVFLDSESEEIVRFPRGSGGLVEIHGLGREFGRLGALHRQTDRTDGGVAVTNEEIDEIWKLVPVGRPWKFGPERRFVGTSRRRGMRYISPRFRRKLAAVCPAT